MRKIQNRQKLLHRLMPRYKTQVLPGAERSIRGRAKQLVTLRRDPRRA
jgi:hypothetical protein